MSYCCIDAAGEIELVNANDFPPVDLGIANFAELDDEELDDDELDISVPWETPAQESPGA